MNIINRLKIGTDCPQCGKHITKLTAYNTLLFCPHCHTHLYKADELPDYASRNNNKNNNHNNTDEILDTPDTNDAVTDATHPTSKKMSRKKRIFISIVVTAFIFLHTHFRHHHTFGAWFEIIGWIYITLLPGFLVFVVLSFLFLNKLATGTYVAGVDTLSEMQSDSCDYIGFSEDTRQRKFICPNCQSRRMADRFWYARITANSVTHNTRHASPHIINQTPTLKPDHAFAGCLHCHTTYQYHQPTNQTHDKTDWVMAFGYIGFILTLSVVRDEYHVLTHPSHPYAIHAQLFFAVLVGAFIFILLSWRPAQQPYRTILLSPLHKATPH